MNIQEIIAKKRDGQILNKEEIHYFITEYVAGNITDYHAAALVMAIYINGMTNEETTNLTIEMAHSGDVLDLSSISKIVVDKHSTGGVGDKITLVIMPIIASLGIPVAKMSGIVLGFTWGTIDKLESIPGYNTAVEVQEFIKDVQNVGISIIGQTGNLAPADKKLYALRDAIACVESIPLIASSIMSKKIAAGADAIVLDVKVGDGAFMKTPEAARELATEMVGIGKHVGRNTVAIISDMDQPLGFAIGNALEVKEAIETLRGNGHKDLLELCLTLGSNMVVLAGAAKDTDEARKMLMETITSGKAIEKLKEFVKAQGGDASVIDNISNFHNAKYVIPVKANKSGVVSKIHAENIGLVAMELGAGRATKESIIDLAVGIVLQKKRGDKVNDGDIIAYIHANDEEKGNKAIDGILANYEISDSVKDIPLIYDIVK